MWAVAISLPAQKPTQGRASSLGFKCTFFLRQMFIISGLRPFNMEHHHRFSRTMRYVLWGLTDLHDDGVDSREFKYFIQQTTKKKTTKKYTMGTKGGSLKLYTCSNFPLEIIFDAESTGYVHTTFCRLSRLEKTKAALKNNGLNFFFFFSYLHKWNVHILQRSLHKKITNGEF